MNYSKLQSLEEVDLKLKYWLLDTKYHTSLTKTQCFSPSWTCQMSSSFFKIWKTRLWHAEPDFSCVFFPPKSPENDFIILLVGRSLIGWRHLLHPRPRYQIFIRNLGTVFMCTDYFFSTQKLCLLTKWAFSGHSLITDKSNCETLDVLDIIEFFHH